MADIKPGFLNHFRDFFSNIVFVLNLAWQDHKAHIIGLGFLRILGAVIPAIQIYIGKLIIDQLVLALEPNNHDGLRALFFFLGLEIGLVLLSQVIGSVVSVLTSTIDEMFKFSVTRKVLEHISSLDLSYFESPQFHDKIEQINREVTWRTSRILMIIYDFGSEIVSLVALGAVFMRLGGVFIIILCGAMLPVLIIEFREAITNHNWRKGWGRWYRRSYYYQQVLSAYEYFQELRLFRISKHFIEYFLIFAEKYKKEYLSYRIKREKSEIAKNIIPNVGYYTGLILMAKQVVSRQFSLGDLTMYMSGYRSAQGSLGGFVRSIGQLYENHLFIRDLSEILAYKPRISIVPNARIIRPEEALAITFDKVTFQYGPDKPPALSDVSFSLGAGGHIALVGENGSGKTTLVKLLLRFYDPTQGRILINGMDLKEIDLESYYARIGGIFQEFVRYEGRVREQISFGDFINTDNIENIKRAAKIGKSESFILKLPQEYETPLGEWEFEDNTQKLSGGQWQRLALSRACMNANTTLVVFDEPSASLDPEAEEKFFEKFLSEAAGKSIIFISHRFSTVRKADIIYLFQDGKIKESGSHEQLMVNNGRYKELFSMQAQWYK